MNGLDHLLYISSTSDSSGTAHDHADLQPGTDPDIAQVQVQNKLQLAMPRAAAGSAAAGRSASPRRNNTFLMVLGFVSSDGTHGPATTSPTSSPAACRTRSAA